LEMDGAYQARDLAGDLHALHRDERAHRVHQREGGWGARRGRTRSVEKAV
jgi:hypothetical protein